MKYVKEENKDLEIVKKSILNNNFHAHPESILLAMLADGNADIRAKAVEMIKKARLVKEKNPGDIRPFKKPTVKQMNFEASHYTEIIKWDKVNVTECPATFKMTEAELDAIALGDTKFMLKRVYCHTVDCERAVGQVTLASQTMVRDFLDLLYSVHNVSQVH